MIVESPTGSLDESLKRIQMWLPEEQKERIWRISTHLKSVSPDDEILKVAEILGLLTVLAREVPEEIAAERQNWKQESKQIEKDLRRLLDQVLEKTVPLINSIESIQSSMGQIVKSVEEVSKSLEETVKDTIRNIDSQWIADYVLKELNTKVVGGVGELNQALSMTQKKMSKTLDSAQEAVDLLRRARWWMPWLVSLCVCSSLFSYFWYSHPRCVHDQIRTSVRGR